MRSSRCLLAAKKKAALLLGTGVNERTDEILKCAKERLALNFDIPPDKRDKRFLLIGIFLMNEGKLLSLING